MNIGSCIFYCYFIFHYNFQNMSKAIRTSSFPLPFSNDVLVLYKRIEIFLSNIRKMQICDSLNVNDKKTRRKYLTSGLREKYRWAKNTCFHRYTESIPGTHYNKKQSLFHNTILLYKKVFDRTYFSLYPATMASSAIKNKYYNKDPIKFQKEI